MFTSKRDDDGRLNYEAFVAGVGAGAMGATTYEWILEHGNGPWPYEFPCWVFTHRDLPKTTGVELTSDEVKAVHRQMLEAAAGRNLWIVGGGDLAGQFADAGLLDEVIVFIAPATLGAGSPLLPRRLGLRLEEAEPNGDFVTARYSVVG